MSAPVVTIMDGGVPEHRTHSLSSRLDHCAAGAYCVGVALDRRLPDNVNDHGNTQQNTLRAATLFRSRRTVKSRAR